VVWQLAPNVPQTPISLRFLRSNAYFFLSHRQLNPITEREPLTQEPQRQPQQQSAEQQGQNSKNYDLDWIYGNAMRCDARYAASRPNDDS